MCVYIFLHTHIFQSWIPYKSASQSLTAFLQESSGWARVDQNADENTDESATRSGWTVVKNIQIFANSLILENLFFKRSYLPDGGIQYFGQT